MAGPGWAKVFCFCLSTSDLGQVQTPETLYQKSGSHVTFCIRAPQKLPSIQGPDQNTSNSSGPSGFLASHGAPGVLSHGVVLSAYVVWWSPNLCIYICTPHSACSCLHDDEHRPPFCFCFARVLSSSTIRICLTGTPIPH
jgi:hypothetical protein